MIWRNLELFRKTRARTLAMVRDLTQEQLDFEPRPGKWSIGEQLDHLRLADLLYRRDIAILIDLAKQGKPAEVRRTVEEINFRPNLIPASWLSWMAAPFTIANLFVPRLLQETMIRYQLFPAQRPDIAQPAKGKTGAELTAALRQSLDESVKLIESNRGLDFHKMVFDHPMLGKSDLPQLVRLNALHEQRHQSQIEAILRRLPARAA
jgi:uncharacterized damage-inducible protein DinB